MCQVVCYCWKDVDLRHSSQRRVNQIIRPSSRIDMVEVLPNFERIQYAKKLAYEFDLIHWPDESTDFYRFKPNNKKGGKWYVHRLPDLRELALWIVSKKSQRDVTDQYQSADCNVQNN
jgi:hypothetical protein